MPPISSDHWMADWVMLWADVSMRATVVLSAMIGIVYVTHRWTAPAWRFAACLSALASFVLVATASLAGWRWEVLPKSWELGSASGFSPLSAIAPLIFATWAVGLTFFAVRLVLGHLSLWRLAATTPAVDSDKWLGRIERLRGQIGLKRTVHVHVSSRRSVPMTWGVFRRHLLLPTSVLDWPKERLDAVILHEMAHIRRADCFWQWWIQVVTCLFWFDPVVWFAKRKMWLERENACDWIAIDSGATPSAYAEALVAVSRQKRKTRPMLAVAMSGGSALYRRLEAILERPPEATTVGKCWIGLWGAVVVVAAVVHPQVASTNSNAYHLGVVKAQKPKSNSKDGQEKPHKASTFASGQFRFDPRLRTFVSDDPSPRLANQLMFRERIVETSDLLGQGQGPVVAISLDDCPVCDGVWDAIGQLDSLRRLQLAKVPLDSMHGLQVPPSVQELDLERVDIQDWDQITCLPMLTSLRIRDAALSRSAFLGISSLTALESLQVEQSQVRSGKVSSFTQLENLRTLSLAGSDVDDASLAMFARLPNLRSLSLADSKITANGLREISRSATIEDLDLTGADVDQQALVALGAMTSLRSVQLSCLDGPVLRILLAVPHLQEIFVRNKAGDLEGLTPDQWRKRVGDRDCPRCFEVKSTTIS